MVRRLRLHPRDRPVGGGIQGGTPRLRGLWVSRLAGAHRTRLRLVRQPLSRRSDEGAPGETDAPCPARIPQAALSTLPHRPLALKTSLAGGLSPPRRERN